MKGLILAGGSGTRLRPLTHTGPKQLIPIANKPNILYCVGDLRAAGITDIGVILGENMPEKVIELLDDGSKFGVKFDYIVQGPAKGIAHAIGCAEDFMGDSPFVVYLGDNILKGGIKHMAEEFIKSEHEAGIALCQVPNPEKFGVAELNEEGDIVSLVEKPKEPKSNLALVGIYFLRSSIFPIIKDLKPSWRNELEVTDAIENLRRSGKRVRAHVVSGWWKDTGKPEDILEANHLILDDLVPSAKGTVEEGSELTGKVSVGEGTVIKKGCVLRGPIIVGNRCTIGPDTYIGPYTSIGDNTTIINSDIEGSIIVGGALIDCRKKIINSLIGKDSEILSSDKSIPKGERLILGECSKVVI